MKIPLFVAALTGLALLGSQSALADGHAGKPVFTPADKVVFQDIIPGVVAFGTVTGNRESGAHGTFVRIPAGKATPLHTHGAAYDAVIIQGRMENPIPGDDSSMTVLAAGSYYHVPAGAKHVTQCASDSPVDCISYFYQSVPFDFAVAE